MCVPSPGVLCFADILYNEKGQFKLTDFGIISDLKERSEQQQMAEAKTFVGTLLYMSVGSMHAHAHTRAHSRTLRMRDAHAIGVIGADVLLCLRERRSAALHSPVHVSPLLSPQPERIGGQSYSYPCDIWSMALSLLTCRVGHFAIPHNSHWELVNSIQAGPDILKCAWRSPPAAPAMRACRAHRWDASPCPCVRTRASLFMSFDDL